MVRNANRISNVVSVCIVFTKLVRTRTTAYAQMIVFGTRNQIIVVFHLKL